MNLSPACNFLTWNQTASVSGRGDSVPSIVPLCRKSQRYRILAYLAQVSTLLWRLLWMWKMPIMSVFAFHSEVCNRMAQLTVISEKVLILLQGHCWHLCCWCKPLTDTSTKKIHLPN
jgi:hypothetical protein